MVNIIVDFFVFLLIRSNYSFTNLLEQLFTLVIGIEFTRMLCSHTPDSIIEVLLFATARQLIVEHPKSMDVLIGVIAIAILFALRKHMIPNSDEENDNVMQKFSDSIKKRKKKSDSGDDFTNNRKEKNNGFLSR